MDSIATFHNGNWRAKGAMKIHLLKYCCDVWAVHRKDMLHYQLHIGSVSSPRSSTRPQQICMIGRTCHV